MCCLAAYIATTAPSRHPAASGPARVSIVPSQTPPLVPEGSAAAEAMDYSQHRWTALTRYLGDPALPIDNNFDEQQIRPWATGRKNWLFAGTLLAGQRAAAIMSLIQTAKLNGHDPYAYLRDVLTRLPTHKNSELGELLPHRWRPGHRPALG